MKWIVATVGALIVWFGATLTLLLVPALAFPDFFAAGSAVNLILAYAVALPLGILAGVWSFRATLRHYAKPIEVKPPVEPSN